MPKGTRLRNEMGVVSYDMANLVKSHLPCTSCGSSDANSIYDDGSTYCFSCSMATKGQHQPTYDVPSTRRVMVKPPVLEYRNNKKRGTPAEVYQTFGAGYSAEKNATAYQHIVNGTLVGIKWRSNVPGTKEFWFEGNNTKVTLYGLHHTPGFGDLIICEGEEDALAMYHAWGGTKAVASVPFGAGSAHEYIKKSLKEIETKFQRIYLCFDNDEPGRVALEKCVPLFKPGKLWVVTLPAGYKDVCELTGAGEYDMLKKAVYGAQNNVPPNFVTGEDWVEEYMEYRKDGVFNGTSWGYEGLDLRIGGAMQGSITMLTGETGIGKSTFAINLYYNLMKAGAHMLLCSFEDGLGLTTDKLVQLELKQNVTRGGTATEDELRAAVTKLSQQITMYKRDGSDTTPEAFLSNLEYHIRSYDTKFILIDHITALIEGMSGSTGDIANKLMAGLRLLVEQYKAHIIVITHLARAKGGSLTLDRLKWASSLGQVPDTVVGVERDRQETTVKVIIMKNNRRWGVSPLGNIMEFECSLDTGEYYEVGVTNEHELDGEEYEEDAVDTNGASSTYAEEDYAKNENKEAGYTSDTNTGVSQQEGSAVDTRRQAVEARADTGQEAPKESGTERGGAVGTDPEQSDHSALREPHLDADAASDVHAGHHDTAAERSTSSSGGEGVPSQSGQGKSSGVPRTRRRAAIAVPQTTQDAGAGEEASNGNATPVGRASNSLPFWKVT
jgi:twinkle protein